jgi:hypothetical protein
MASGYNRRLPPVLFYVSGHGYGHATRMAEVLRAGAPHWSAIVRTTAPARLFPGSPVERATIDAAVAESPDTLRIDPGATRRNWTAFLDQRAAIIDREVSYVRRSGVRVIVADIPLVAGEIADAAGVPCVGISNFTWSWILEPHAPDLVPAIDAAYARFHEYWRLPFHHPDDRSTFPSVVETPLIAPALPPRHRIDDRPTILVGFRGALPETALQRAIAESPDLRFLTLEDGDFAWLAAASDVILAKLGYGLAATCSAHKIRLLHAPREGFREDEITSVEVGRYTALRPIPLDDLETGNWRPHLDRLLADPIPAATIPDDGATVCAERIRSLLA